MKNDSWQIKIKRWWRIKLWFLKANWRHRKIWLMSKEYRKSYGDCDCFKGKRQINEEYCKNNPKCNLKKIKVSYIDSL